MKQLLLALPMVLICTQFAARADTLLPGTQIRVRSESQVGVSRWDRGRIYPARVAQDVYARDGDLAIPRGSYAELIVRETGPGQLALDLESVTANGRRYVMDATGPQFNMDANTYNSGAGLLGTIVGAIAGVETRGGEIRVPSGSVLTFQLQEPLYLVGWQDEGYMQNGYHYHRYERHGWYR